MATKRLYKGFSTHQFEYDKSLTLYDVELVKRDLINHFFTRRGERKKMNQYGTLTPDLLFDPLDETTINTVRTDLLTVIEYDPRVVLIDDIIIDVNYDTHTIKASAYLNYVELDLQDRFDLNLSFEQ